LNRYAAKTFAAGAHYLMAKENYIHAMPMCCWRLRTMKAELVVIMKGGRKQKNVKGAILADKSLPPFAANHDGYYLRWWGVDHPASKRIRELARVNGFCPNRDLCFCTRLNISEKAIEDGWRCAFEEHHQLWQCHLSGKWQEPEPEPETT